MYSKHEISRLREEFWTAFGVYMNLHLSSEGEIINWINYKTGIKNLRFRMDADANEAVIAIELTDRDSTQRKLFYEQLVSVKGIFHQYLDESWNWIPVQSDRRSRIETRLENVNIFNKSDWPAIISFFKPRLIALDAFWNEVKPGFEQ